MEHENNYASKGIAGTALGIAIGAGALGLMSGNGTNLFGNTNNCGENALVNRYEASQSARIAQLETQVQLRDANTYTDGKMLELYKYFDGKIGCIERELCDQRVFNATQISTIGCIQNQVAQLMSLTKTVIPNASVCPGWGNVTVTPSTTG